MRLSEAIRLGAMMKPQARLDMVADGKTCALGAAADAIGKLSEWGTADSYNVWREQWPILRQEVSVHVARGYRTAGRLLEVITRLNDDHNWSREQIADWVESIEQAQTPQVETVAEKVAVEK